ncbi:phage tail tube protein [Glutamicibacter ardleyensis]|uniref:phage tail tube protein n=1 Tax=Glutamicibacter ardleyensis TaxID=225894 RepID=UPI003FCEF212
MTPPITPGVLGDWLLEVAEYADGTTPTAWTPVLGIMELTPPQTEKNLEDDGEFDGTHWGSQVATGISWTAEATVKTPRASLPADPGQAILKAASREVLEGGFVHVRFSQRGVTPKAGDEGVADVTYVDAGGPKTDLTTAELTLTGRGALVPFTAAA